MCHDLLTFSIASGHISHISNPEILWRGVSDYILYMYAILLHRSQNQISINLYRCTVLWVFSYLTKHSSRITNCAELPEKRIILQSLRGSSAVSQNYEYLAAVASERKALKRILY